MGDHAKSQGYNVQVFSTQRLIRITPLSPELPPAKPPSIPPVAPPPLVTSPPVPPWLPSSPGVSDAPPQPVKPARKSASKQNTRSAAMVTSASNARRTRIASADVATVANGTVFSGKGDKTRARSTQAKWPATWAGVVTSAAMCTAGIRVGFAAVLERRIAVTETLDTLNDATAARASNRHTIHGNDADVTASPTIVDVIVLVWKALRSTKECSGWASHLAAPPLTTLCASSGRWRTGGATRAAVADCVEWRLTPVSAVTVAIIPAWIANKRTLPADTHGRSRDSVWNRRGA